MEYIGKKAWFKRNYRLLNIPLQLTLTAFLYAPSFNSSKFLAQFLHHSFGVISVYYYLKNVSPNELHRFSFALAIPVGCAVYPQKRFVTIALETKQIFAEGLKYLLGNTSEDT